MNLELTKEGRELCGWCRRSDLRSGRERIIWEKVDAKSGRTVSAGRALEPHVEERKRRSGEDNDQDEDRDKDGLPNHAIPATFGGARTR